MKKLFVGALICLSGVASHAHEAPLSAADKALLSQVTQDQYQALIYTVSECGFEPSARVAVTLLKSAALPAITAAVVRYNEPAPVLDTKACAAFGLHTTRTASK